MWEVNGPGDAELELADLVDEPWVLPPPESSLASVAQEAFRNTGLNFPRATVIAVLPEIRISLLALGRFLTIFPRSVLRLPTRPEVKILPVELPVSRMAVEAVTLKNRTLSPLARQFIEEAREVAKLLGKAKR